MKKIHTVTKLLFACLLAKIVMVLYFSVITIAEGQQMIIDNEKQILQEENVTVVSSSVDEEADLFTFFENFKANKAATEVVKMSNNTKLHYHSNHNIID